MNTLKILLLGLWIIGIAGAVDHKNSPRVLLGEGRAIVKEYGCYLNSMNYDGDYNHHQASGYCTVSFSEENEPSFRPDILGDLTVCETWKEISKTKRSLIADMTYIPDIHCSLVIGCALDALDTGGTYLIPALIRWEHGQFIVQTEVYNDKAPENVHFSTMLTSSRGIAIGEDELWFPDREIITKGSKRIDTFIRNSYPTTAIKEVVLNPSPLIRAFWGLSEEIQESLCDPVEQDLLVAYAETELKKSVLSLGVEIRAGLEKRFEEQPFDQFCFYINYHLSQGRKITRADFIEIAKNEAKEEQALYGDYFGQSGTTFAYGYLPNLPFTTVPAYITIVKG